MVAALRRFALLALLGLAGGLLASGCTRDRGPRMAADRGAAVDRGKPPPDEVQASRRLARQIATLPRPPLREAEAMRFAALSLACYARPYPNKPSHVYEADAHVRPPRQLTPAFFGCFDWHSAVHGHWTMTRLLRRFPNAPRAAELRRTLGAQLTKQKLAAELAFFRAPRNRLFERPYGWGWLLRLAAELHDWDDPDAQRWLAALRPLARFLGERTVGYLDRLSVPVRAGTHNNTAYAMAHALDYARAVGDRSLAASLEKHAQRLFGGDRDCPTDYEPSGEDFISPCLAEADLMRRVLPGPRFARWLRAFLPSPGSARFAPLRAPTEVRDLKDPKIGHLIGLALQRASAFEGIASVLPAEDAWRPVLIKLARVHLHRALSQMFSSGYGGEHWLASFAVFALTNAGHPPVR